MKTTKVIASLIIVSGFILYGGYLNLDAKDMDRNEAYKSSDGQSFPTLKVHNKSIFIFYTFQAGFPASSLEQVATRLHPTSGGGQDIIVNFEPPSVLGGHNSKWIDIAPGEYTHMVDLKVAGPPGSHWRVTSVIQQDK